jgi:hypothetical protein
MAAAFRFPAYPNSNFINNRRYLNNPYGASYVADINQYADYFLSAFPNKNPNSYDRATLLKWISRFAGNYYNYLENPTQYLGVDGGALWSSGWFNSVPLFVIDQFALHGNAFNNATVDASGNIYLRHNTNLHGMYPGMAMTITTTEITTGNGWPSVPDPVYVKPVFYTTDTANGLSVQLFTDSGMTTALTTDKTPGDYALSATSLTISTTETYRYKMAGGKLVWRGGLSGYGGTVPHETTDTVFGLPRTVQVPIFRRGFISSRGGANTLVSPMNSPQWLFGNQIGTALDFEKIPQSAEQDSLGSTIAADISAGYLPSGAEYVIGASTSNPYTNLIKPDDANGHFFGDTVALSGISGNVATVTALGNYLTKIVVGNTLSGTIDGVVLEANQTLFTRVGNGPQDSYYLDFFQNGVANIQVGYIVEGPNIYPNTVVTEINPVDRSVELSKPTFGSSQFNATYSFKVPGVQIIQQLTSTFTTAQGSATISNVQSNYGNVAGDTSFTVSSAANIQVGDIMSGTNVPLDTFVIDVDGTTVAVKGVFTGATSGTYNFRRAGLTGNYRINRTYGTLGAGTANVRDLNYDLGYFPKLACFTGGRTGPEDTEVFVIGRGMTGGGYTDTTPDPIDGERGAEYPGRFSATAPVAVYFQGIPSTYQWRWATQANDVQWQSPWETDLGIRDATSNYDNSHNSSVKQWPRHINPQSMTYSIEQPTRMVESSNLTRWTRDSGVVRWKFKLNYPPMTREDFLPFMTAIHTAHGESRGFRLYIGDIAGFTSVQNKSGFLPPGYENVQLRDMICYSNEAKSAGETFFTIDGFRPRVNNAVNAGDIIKITHTANGQNFYNNYVIINTGDSDEMGRVRIRISHPLIAPIALGVAHRLSPSHVWVSLNTNQQDFDISTAHLYGFNVEFVTQPQLGQINYQNRGLV